MPTLEYVKHCETCEEKTPHSRRSFSAARALVTALLLFAVLVTVLTANLLVGVLPTAVGILNLAYDREQCWSLACDRCRGKARAAVQRTKPTLNGHTEIQPW